MINTGSSCPVCRSIDTAEYRDCLARSASWLCATCNTVFVGSTEEYDMNRKQRSRREDQQRAIQRSRQERNPKPSSPRSSPLPPKVSRDAGGGDELDAPDNTDPEEHTP